MKDEIELLLDTLYATTGPMGGYGREKIHLVLEEQTIETWDDVHLFVLTSVPFCNFLTAVQAVDPTFPVPEKKPHPHGLSYYPWLHPPTREVLIDALKYAAFRQPP